MRTAKSWAFTFYAVLIGILVAVGGFGLVRFAPGASAQNNAVGVCSWPLPLPSQIGPEAYEKQINQYVSNYCYQKDPKWLRDSEIRSTGPLLGTPTSNQFNYGVHKAVRVYYSPEVGEWMKKGEPEGKIPEGGTIIKEMYPLPANQSYTNANIGGLAIMVRDSKVAWDGWFWSDGAPTISYQFNYPSSGYALYCFNCHASTAKTDLTFSAMRNVTGDPLVFSPTMPPNQITLPTATRARASNVLMEQPQEGNAVQQAQQADKPGVHEKETRAPNRRRPRS